MNHEEHQQRHVRLHQALDELVADYLAQTRGMPSTTTLMDLLRWSLEQTQNPTRNQFEDRTPSHIPEKQVDRG